MLPAAPGRFSTITCWPSALPSCSAVTRARMSVDCPAGKGTMMRSGLVGHAWARAGKANRAAPVRADRRSNIPYSGMTAGLLLGRLLLLLRRVLAGDLEEVLEDLV